MPPRLTFIMGCTGCGKGTVARELAQQTGGEIVSVDSMKVYRRMDIGTAKPSAADRVRIPHHMIDVVEPSEEFSVAQYVEAAENAIADIHKRGRPIFVVGGTVLYIRGLSEGLFEGPGADSQIRERLHQEATRDGSAALHERLRSVDALAADRIHPNDLRRIVRALEVFEVTGRPITALQTQWDRERTHYPCEFIGLRRGREDQNRRTNRRAKRMIEAGLLDEVKSLLAEPMPLSGTARKAVGYAELIGHLQGRSSLDEAVEMIKINTRQLAKAQRTWFKRLRGIAWIELPPDATAAGAVEQIIRCRGSKWSA